MGKGIGAGVGVLFMLFAAAIPAAAKGSCIGCHTDEAVLKSLFSPPKAAPAEGEG